MNNGAMKRALGLVLLYFGIFILIVVVQFSRTPGFSEKFGKLTVSASYSKSTRAHPGTSPDSVRITFDGLVIGISSENKAEGLAADGSVQPLAPRDVERLPNGVRIKLGADVSLSAVSDKASPDRFSLSVAASDAISALRVRMLSSSTKITEAAGQRKMETGLGAYSVNLGAGSMDTSSGTLTLKAGDAGLALTKVPGVVAAKPATAASIEKFVAQAPKDQAIFSSEIGAWRDKAWSGLATTRFDAEKVAWKGLDGVSVFSEKALVAYVAEAFARGSYPDALTRAKAAKEKYADKIGYLSAPYVGGLVQKMRVLSGADQAEIKRLSAIIAAKSPGILEKEGLLLFLADRAPVSLLQDALRLIGDADIGTLTMRQTVGFLSCVMDARDLLKDDENNLRDGSKAADRLVAATRKTSSGYFLATEDDGSTDLRLSLVAGTALVAYGSAVSKPTYLGLGQSLVEGVIGLADAQGFTPSRAFAKNGNLEQKMGSLAPEDLYPLLADNPAYPHEESFARTLGPGLWAWTCVPSLTVQEVGSRYVFTASFPVGRSHYLAFYGIKPFVNIQLYDIDYSPDNDFESYDASGYLYDKDASVLYLKMKHKKESEAIKLTF